MTVCMLCTYSIVQLFCVISKNGMREYTASKGQVFPITQKHLYSFL